MEIVKIFDYETLLLVHREQDLLHGRVAVHRFIIQVGVQPQTNNHPTATPMEAGSLDSFRQQ